MKNILKSLVIVVAVAAVAGGATWAYFTDQAKNTNNTFAAGTLDISVSPTTQAVKVEKAEPGVWYKWNQMMTVMNNGNISPLKWKVSSEKVSETDADFYDLLWVSVWVKGLTYDENPKIAPDGSTINGTEVYNGLLKNLNHQFVKNFPSGWSASVWVFTGLDSSAGNNYQGDSAQFNLVFDATQSNNPGW